MILATRKKAFAALGKFLAQFSGEKAVQNPDVPFNNRFFEAFGEEIEMSVHHNGWFTQNQVLFALRSWAEALTEEDLDQWTSAYKLEPETAKTVALILAGNIPLVGFHDFLSVLISGHKALVKTSSNDSKLLPFLAKYLAAVEPEFEDSMAFADGKLENFQAVIATGSNNTARYFDYYFRDKPSIIRKNRNSVAVLTGKETTQELAALGEDIFRYFGLGCRNVSKLFVPEGYDFKDFFEAIFAQADVINYEKYAHNYDYNKAVFLMSNYKLLDNGFLTLKEDVSYASPISSVFYEFYKKETALLERLQKDADQIQGIVGTSHIPFGQTQKPALWDYADGVDTLSFLDRL